MRKCGVAASFVAVIWSGSVQGQSLSQMSCDEFNELLALERSGSTEPMPLAAAAYRAALVDAFSWHYGTSNVERELHRVLDLCDGNLSEATQNLSENVFDDFETYLRDQIEYEQ